MDYVWIGCEHIRARTPIALMDCVNAVPDQRVRLDENEN